MAFTADEPVELKKATFAGGTFRQFGRPRWVHERNVARVVGRRGGVAADPSGRPGSRTGTRVVVNDDFAEEGWRSAWHRDRNKFQAVGG